MSNENKCDHNYFLASKTEEMRKPDERLCSWDHYKIGTLVCRKCADVKQVTLDLYKAKR